MSRFNFSRPFPFVGQLMVESKVKGMGLAVFGRKKLSLAEQPGVYSCREEFGPLQPLKSFNGSLHIPIQTGVLFETLQAPRCHGVENVLLNLQLAGSRCGWFREGWYGFGIGCRIAKYRKGVSEETPIGVVKVKREQGRPRPCRGAEADSHRPDHSEDHRNSTGAVH